MEWPIADTVRCASPSDEGLASTEKPDLRDEEGRGLYEVRAVEVCSLVNGVLDQGKVFV